jgi:uncharacterized membrane protein YhiD involved in acid resistance
MPPQSAQPPEAGFESVLGSLGMEHVDLGRFELILLRMVIAGLLGAFLGYRLWRRLLPNTLPPARETAQAQTLIAIAGALMVVVIGQSTARAFGLVGLGGFIRFRSGIKDTRDAAVMFVMIGIGMACGLGLPVMALGGTAFVCVLLLIFDATLKLRAKRTLISINADDPPGVWPKVAALFPNTRVVELSSVKAELGKDSGKLVLELDLRGTMDAASIREMLEKGGVQGISRVALVE